MALSRDEFEAALAQVSAVQAPQQDDQFDALLDSSLAAFGEPQPDQGLMESAVEGVTDFGKAAGAELTKIPVGATGLALSAVEAAGGRNTRGLNQFLGQLYSLATRRQLLDDDVFAELGNTDIQDTRDSIVNTQQQVDKVIQQAKERSPIGGNVGQLAAGIGQLAGVGTGAKSAVELAKAGAKVGGAAGLGATPEEGLTSEQELLQRGLGVAGGAAAGAALTPAIVKGAPALFKGAGKVASTTQNAIKSIVPEDLAMPKISTPFAAKLKGMWGIDENVVREMEAAGVTPNVMATTKRATLKAIIGYLARYPGGIGPVRDALKKSVDDLLPHFEQFGIKGTSLPRSELGLGVDANRFAAGKVVQKKVRDYKTASEKAYEKAIGVADKFLGKAGAQARESITNLSKVIDDIESGFGGTKNTQALREAFNNSGLTKKLRAIRDSARTNKGEDSLRVGTMRQLRTELRDSIRDKHLVGNRETSHLKRLEEALTKDLMVAYKKRGNQKGVDAFEAANKVWREFSEEMNLALDNVMSKNAPEEVINIIVNGADDAPSAIGAIMNTLESKLERDLVLGSVLKRLGTNSTRTITKGGEEVTMDIFSPLHLSRQLEAIGKEGQRALFKGAPKGLAEAFEQLNGMANRFSSLPDFGSRSAAEPISLGFMLAFGGLGGMSTGDPVNAAMGAVLAPLTAIGGAKIGAKLMMNPKFVRWLANVDKEMVKVDKGGGGKAMANMIGKLTKIAKAHPEDAAAIKQYVEEVGGVLTGTTPGVVAGQNIGER